MVPRLVATLTVLLLATSCMSLNEPTSPTSIQDPINLRNATDFSVLAYATVTNTGLSSVGGLVGVSPGSAVTGTYKFAELPIVSEIAGVVASAACKADVGTAYLEAAGRGVGVVGINVVNIGGMTFTAGLYKTTGALAVSSGTLTLSGKGVYIFQIETTLTVGTNLEMVLTNGALASDVFWKVGSSAIFQSGSSVVGTVMAYASIDVITGAKVEGRLFALNAAVNLDSNKIDFYFPRTVDTVVA
jgi:hypothetical protein